MKINKDANKNGGSQPFAHKTVNLDSNLKTDRRKISYLKYGGVETINKLPVPKIKSTINKRKIVILNIFRIVFQ